MLTAEITQLVTKLDYGDRAELVGMLIDSLDGEDPGVKERTASPRPCAVARK